MTEQSSPIGLYGATGKPSLRIPDALVPSTNGVVPNELGELLAIRDAVQEDIPALTKIRDAPDQFLGYLNRADGNVTRFLVCGTNGRLVAFAMLYLRKPAAGSRKSHMPRFSDLYTASEFRSQGIGTTMVKRMEELAVEHGHDSLYLGVDPIDNPRALDLYKRLGYSAVDGEPSLRSATFYDDAGSRSEVEYWSLDLVKHLKPI